MESRLGGGGGVLYTSDCNSSVDNDRGCRGRRADTAGRVRDSG
jgi:hypothetical protein